jgi:hypothetical protein
VQLLLIELVDRVAPAGALADLAVDLRRWQSLGYDAARNVRQFERGWRIITFVRDGDDVVAHAEGEQHLCGRWNQADYPHGRNDGTSQRR